MRPRVNSLDDRDLSWPAIFGYWALVILTAANAVLWTYTFPILTGAVAAAVIVYLLVNPHIYRNYPGW